MKILSEDGYRSEAHLDLEDGEIELTLYGVEDVAVVRLNDLLGALLGAGVVIGINQQQLEELAMYLAEEK